MVARIRPVETTTERLRRKSRAQPLAGPFSRVMSNLYFAMFAWQIFSPSYFGLTIYLECFIAVLNPDFWAWLATVKLKRSAVFGFIILCALYVPVDKASAVASLFTAITVLYLVFAFESRTFYLFRYLAVSMLVALAQWYLVGKDVHWANVIGPTALASDVWGSHATGTYTNFYAIIGGVTRVSGLSREAGFFAALLIEAICLYWVVRGRSKLMLLLFAAAFYVSLSKMSFVILPLAWIIWKRDSLAKVPWLLALGCWVGALFVFAEQAKSWLLDPGRATFLDRFGVSIQFPHLTAHQLFFGTTMDKISSPYTPSFTKANLVGQGIPGFIIHEGLLVFFVYLVFWLLCGIRTPGVLFLCLATMNETFRTCQNFVSLAYFFALYVLPGLTAARRSGAVLTPRGLEVGSLLGHADAPSGRGESEPDPGRGRARSAPAAGVGRRPVRRYV